MSEPLFGQILAHDGVLVLEREERKAFRPHGTIPEWVSQAVAPADRDAALRQPGAFFPFIDHFLEDAEVWWAGGGAGELRSEPWSEAAVSGADIHLDARACFFDGKPFLLVRRLNLEFARTQRAMRIFRELSLEHERTLSEISKKEILLHCIVHDLSGPLNGMRSAFNLLARESLSAEGEKFRQLGQHAGQQQANFISDMLDTFRAEVFSADKLAGAPGSSPDIVATARSVIEGLATACEISRIRIPVALTPGTPEVLPVLGERNRLERIFYNLLQNAMRHSPPGSEINVTIDRAGEEVLVSVDDCGQGIGPAIAPQLFQKLIRGAGKRGEAGLGLYYCRITVEQWNGAIGYNPRPEGGSHLWFRLKTPEAS